MIVSVYFVIALYILFFWGGGSPDKTRAHVIFGRVFEPNLDGTQSNMIAGRRDFTLKWRLGDWWFGGMGLSCFQGAISGGFEGKPKGQSPC